jgi:hypothetical protein
LYVSSHYLVCYNPNSYYIKSGENIQFPNKNVGRRLKENLKDAILTRALSRLIDLLVQEAQPVQGGQNCAYNLLALAVS